MKVIKHPDKIIMENFLFISKSLNLIFLQFSNKKLFSSSEGLLKVNTVKTKKYGKEAMLNNVILSWNNIQKIISSHVLRDLSYSKFKSLLVKHFP